ncbi:MAG: hypothetical protein ABJE95_21240 [Byssovorax sp.]
MDLSPRLKRHDLRARALWAAFFATVALVLGFRRPAPPSRTADGVATMLGEASGGEVRADDFVWEERGGFVSDAFLGRRVLFLARRGAGAPADLYRARVRLTRSGRPIGVGELHNLTRSPLGDDRELVAHGRHAAFVTSAGGRVQGITLLDLDGEGASREARTGRERFGASIQGVLATGSPAGIGRTEVTFEALPDDAKVELSDDALVMALGKEGAAAALDLRTGAVNAGPRNPFSARALRIPGPARPLGEAVIAAVDELGGPASARAVASVIGLFSRAKSARATPDVFPGREAPIAAPSVDDWPPATIVAVVKPAIAGEGVWAAGRGAPILPGAPPALYETAIRPRPDQPQALVRLVAMDLRQLDLRLEAGFASPRSASGIHGGARLPDGAIADRVVAAFTAGPAGASAMETTPEPGFVVNQRALAALVPGAAAVVLGRDEGVVLGPWPGGAEAPVGIASVLQTPDALLGGDRAAVIPIEAAAARRERSALCVLPSGHLIYAESGEADAATMASALRLAGCVYGVHLAAEPAPVGFAYLHAAGAAGVGERTWDAKPLAAGMSLDPARLASGSPNGFFYAVSRDLRPRAPLPAGDVATKGWTVDEGTQPAPAWIPSIHTAVVSSLGANVHVTTVAPGRTLFRLRSGGKEPATKTSAALPGALSEGEQARALAVVSLGSGRRRGARGLAIEGAVGFPFRGEATGVLVIEKGRPQIAIAAGFTLPEGADATELPLTADEGKLRPEARDVGSMRARAAACVLADGTFAVASTTFDSDEAATSALIDLGCARIVALDRGMHSSFFLHRAGAEPAPVARYETTVLDLVDAPMRGRATRFSN